MVGLALTLLWDRPESEVCVWILSHLGSWALRTSWPNSSKRLHADVVDAYLRYWRYFAIKTEQYPAKRSSQIVELDLLHGVTFIRSSPNVYWRLAVEQVIKFVSHSDLSCFTSLIQCCQLVRIYMKYPELQISLWYWINLNKLRIPSHCS